MRCGQSLVLCVEAVLNERSAGLCSLGWNNPQHGSAVNRRAQRGKVSPAWVLFHLPSCAASVCSCLGTHNPPKCLCLFSQSLQTNCPGLFFDLGTFPCFSPCQHSCSAWQGTRISSSTPWQAVQLTAAPGITESLQGAGAVGHREEL